MESNRFKVKKYSSIESFEESRSFPSQVNLNTFYSSDKEIGERIGGEGYEGLCWFKIQTAIVSGNCKLWVAPVMGNDILTNMWFSLEGESAIKHQKEITGEHIKKSREIEERLGPEASIREGVLGQQRAYAVSVSEDKERGRPIYTLNTKLRAPRYFMKDGFVVDGESISDVTVVSRSVGVEKPKRNSRIIRPDGSAIEKYDAQGNEYYSVHLPVMHHQAIIRFLGDLGEHYSDDYSFSYIMDEFPEIISHVDRWDKKQRELTKSAEKIAKVIAEKSPLRDRVKGIIVYGSLARNDKCPDDIDLLILADSDKILNPIKYYVKDYGRKKAPSGYNVAAVTVGLIKELGLEEEILSIGIKNQDYPNEVECLQFSDEGGGLNINAISTEFFRNPEFRERLMRMAFTAQYFRNALSDGMAYNLETGRFDIPTKEIFGGTIESLEGVLEKAKIEEWPNITNEAKRKSEKMKQLLQKKKSI